MIDDRVTCEQCKRKFLEAGKADVRDFFRIGTIARYRKGHAVYFDRDGSTALCAAVKREPRHGRVDSGVPK